MITGVFIKTGNFFLEGGNRSIIGAGHALYNRAKADLAMSGRKAYSKIFQRIPPGGPHSFKSRNSVKGRVVRPAEKLKECQSRQGANANSGLAFHCDFLQLL